MNAVKMQREMILQRLKEQGCRITKQRLALIDIILEMSAPAVKKFIIKLSEWMRRLGLPRYTE